MQCLELFHRVISSDAPIFEKGFERAHATFGVRWARELDAHLECLFGCEEQEYRNAVQGYARVSLSAMRLQAQLNRKRTHEDPGYEAGCFDLAGTLISQFLWKHRYRRLQFHREAFLPLLDGTADKRFYDVGSGTGLYSVQVLRCGAGFRGYGIDASPRARDFTARHVDAWGFGADYTTVDANVLDAGLEPLAFVQSIELLERQANPGMFLSRLRKMLAPGGYGFLSAAIAAPHDDDGCAYGSSGDVVRQFKAAGFKVLDSREEPAYEGGPGEIVPRVAAFIVQ